MIDLWSNCVTAYHTAVVKLFRGYGRMVAKIPLIVFIVGLLFGSTANESYCASLGAIKDSLKSRLSECCPTPTKGE